MKKPIFMISLDLELGWGLNTLNDFKFLNLMKNNIRKTIFILINFFEKYKIPVTWAIVGHLFLDSCKNEKCLTQKNKNIYNYNKEYYHDPYTNINKDPLFYGKDIIERILANTINHDIGYHSFSHPIFTRISRDMARDEIKEVINIGRNFDIKFKSFVYPKNEIAYVDILKEYGFKIYRGKTAGLYNKKSNLLKKKITGGIGKIIADPVEPKLVEGIWEIQGSMLFYDSQIPRSLIPRAKIGLLRTLKNKKIFHIWLHPWNLLKNRRSINDIEIILKYIFNLKRKNKILVLTMKDLAEILN